MIRALRRFMPMSLRLKSVVLLLLACLALVTGCKKESGTASSGPGKIRLQLNWKPEPQFGGFYAAELSGAFKKQGLDVEIVPGGVGTPTAQMVAAGKTEFGISTADE